MCGKGIQLMQKYSGLSILQILKIEIYSSHIVPFNRNGDNKILRVYLGDHSDKEGQKVICVQRPKVIGHRVKDRSEGTKLLRSTSYI
jgi:hypothetical protein